jgi:hypothetical protein
MKYGSAAVLGHHHEKNVTILAEKYRGMMGVFRQAAIVPENYWLVTSAGLRCSGCKHVAVV